MPIYNPPKENNWGSAMQVAGTTVSSLGSTAMAIPGIGPVVGIASMAAGSIMGLLGQKSSMRNQKSLEEYNRTYEAQVNGEKNIQQSINTNKEFILSRERINNLSGLNL